jgi:hypothetical protein
MTRSPLGAVEPAAPSASRSPSVVEEIVAREVGLDAEVEALRAQLAR